MTFNTQAVPAWTVGQEYRFTLRQMGSKSPWVRADFPFMPSGKVKHERMESTGHYITLTFPNFAPLFVFKVSATDSSSNKVTAILLTIL